MVAQCAKDDCNKRPGFNFTGEKRGKFCSAHKETGMIDVVHKKCLFENCNTQPTYNHPDEKKSLYCKTHKLDGMVDVRHIKCKHYKCKKRPCCNYENMLVPEYCSEHKLDDMINVTIKKCLHDDCDKIPSFNYEGLNRLYCSQHKLEGMVDVSHRLCEHEGCNIQAVYNVIGQKSGRFCVNHKLEGMIDVGGRCIVSECYDRAQYNYKDQTKKLYCVKHKKPDMVNICTQNCAAPGCFLSPNYNYKGLSPIYCSKHKLSEMIDVRGVMCINEGCITLKNKNIQYKGYCVRCFIHLFPNENISKNFRIKERFVTDFIKEKFSSNKIIYNKTAGGCSLNRPDIYIDLLTHVIIIEIDESQHKYYDTTCEIKRLNNLFEDFGYRSIIFIRFNPDGYIDKHGVKIKSCFDIDIKTGIQKVAKNKKTEWNLRLQKLKNTITKNINNIPDDNKFEYLYFDN